MKLACCCSPASGVFALILLSALTGPIAGAEPLYWNQFRGPNGSGVAPEADICTELGPETNVLWKTPLPRGLSSPVIWADLIFVTASPEEGELATICIDRRTGRIAWQRSVQAQSKVRLHPTNGPASPTPAVDANCVYAYFGGFGLICYDHAGHQLWQRPLEPPASQYGAAASPILYQDTLILVLDDNSGKSQLLAVNCQTGNTAWSQPRPLFRAGWSTPMIWRHDDVDELVVLGFKRLTSYNPSTGEELWWAGGFSPESVGVPVAGEGVLFASSSAMAGRGDEKWDTAAVWKAIAERFDTNRDNQIQRSEMTEGFTIPIRPELSIDNPGWGLPGRNQGWMMNYFDKDKSQTISETEWNETMAGFSMDTEPILLAVKPGARGNARDSHQQWICRRGVPETPSILYHRGRIYMLRAGGQLTCLDAATGDEIYRERIGASGHYVASPIAADDKIIAASAAGVVTVIQAGDEMKVLSQSAFKQKIFATPAVADNTLYLRTDKSLYALGR